MGTSKTKSICSWFADPVLSTFVFFFFLFAFCICLLTCAAKNSITPTQALTDGQSLVSPNNLFELTFFSLGDPQNRYLGIRYNPSNPKVAAWMPEGLKRQDKYVWVANREKPVTDSSGVFTVQNGGNLVVMDGKNKTVWSSNTLQATNDSIAELLDSGNLVLRDVNSGRIIWQSFDHPSDTLLPGMKIGVNLRTGENWMLRSWINDTDPSPGSFTFGIDPQALKQFFIWRRSVPYSRRIFWNGTAFQFTVDDWPTFFNCSFISSEDEVYFNYLPYEEDTIYNHITMKYDGTIWLQRDGEGSFFTGEMDQCSDTGGGCGPRSICNSKETPPCKCLPGFTPTLPRYWGSGIWDEGCTRITLLKDHDDGDFLTLKRVKILPPKYYTLPNTEANCAIGAAAYAYRNESRNDNLGTCYHWSSEDDLKDFEENTDEEGLIVDLKLRLASSELQLIGRQCRNCGANIIPYPLSTEPNCGDPLYTSIRCNTTTGQLRFHALNGVSYAIASFKPEDRKVVIKPEGVDLCWANSLKRNDIHLNSSLPFYVTNNNTIFLLNCSNHEQTSHLNCSSSSLCHRYMVEGGAPCFIPNTCCSYKAGDSPSTLHTIGVSDTGCATFASIVRIDSSIHIYRWREGIEIGWETPREPVCLATKDCKAWPNTTCSSDKEEVGRKRCFCNENFKWNGSIMNCTLDGDKKGSQRSLGVIIIVIPSAILGLLLLRKSTRYFCNKMGKKKGSSRKGSNMTINGLEMSTKRLLAVTKFREDGNSGIDVPFINFESILEATEGFSDSNKIGQGGFGPVYRGNLLGEPIAVKRLSKSSGQGLKEFQNEVLLIAKLQHRNLVKLLGYCIERDEKILIYEHMPNKSLDFFLFDPNRCKMLDWQMRYNIILGITRGLMYLHQDSRLRIIHRDFKTSNILLDEEMNPKISDFGMARIFWKNQTQENTNKVVGTYGYISPEYAARGLFSIKSDVYSFGIVLFEIISGKKNSNFYNYEHSLSLTGYAWQLWKEERGLDLIDPSLNNETYDPFEVLKCIHVSLLCVQENATDRPTMTSILIMLESESACLPMPNQPAFYVRSTPTTQSFPIGPMNISRNEVTISTMEGR